MLTPGGVEAGAGYPVDACDQDPALIGFNKVWLQHHGGVRAIRKTAGHLAWSSPWCCWFQLSLWRPP